MDTNKYGLKGLEIEPANPRENPSPNLKTENQEPLNLPAGAIRGVDEFVRCVIVGETHRLVIPLQPYAAALNSDHPQQADLGQRSAVLEW